MHEEKQPTLKVAVKYCGGCNCSYDRVAMVEDLKRQFPAITIVNAEGQDGIHPDLVLVVCGCLSECATHDHLKGKYGTILTGCAGDFARVRETIARHLT